MKIALLIDGDNASAKYIDKVFKLLSDRGDIVERHIFGDWSSPTMTGWQEAILHHALRQNQQNSYVKGKNATDIALVIAAMKLLYTKDIDEFAIMSSDSDFTPLVQELRQHGKKVLGLVGNQASNAFCKACNEHIVLDSNTETNLTDDDLQKHIYNAIQTTKGEDGFARIANINQVLKKLGINPKDYDCVSFTQLIQKTNLFRFKRIDDHLCVAIKNKSNEPIPKKPEDITKESLFGIAITAFDECMIDGFGEEGFISASHIGQKISQKNIDYSTHFAKLSLLLDAVPNLSGEFNESRSNYVYRLKQLPNRPAYIPRRTALKILEVFKNLDSDNDIVAIETLISGLYNAKINFKTLGFQKSYEFITSINKLYLIEEVKEGKTLRYVTDKKEIYDQWQIKPTNQDPSSQIAESPNKIKTSINKEIQSESKLNKQPYTKEQLRACSSLVSVIKNAIAISKEKYGKANADYVFALMEKNINPQEYGYQSCKDIYMAMR